MFKVQTSCGLLVKSFKIYDILDCVLATKGSEYQFFREYLPMSYNEFTKMFLTETRNGHDYTRLECALYTQIDLIDYAEQYQEQENPS